MIKNGAASVHRRNHRVLEHYIQTREQLNRIKKQFLLYAFIYLAAFGTVSYVIISELRIMQAQMLVRDIIKEGIDYDGFRDVRLTRDSLMKAKELIKEITKHYPEFKDRKYIDPVGYLTFSMMAKHYDLLEYRVLDEASFIRGIGKVAKTPGFLELYDAYNAILSDLMYFPVPKVVPDIADVTYDNTWYNLRSYGGNRRHEGTDLMASNNERGFFPVLSITDGVVEKMGWLEQGGYRIGIRAPSGGYFYYAHLNSYAPGLKKGDKVIAGQMIGFMGDSGYGKEGTVGKFDVHLHLGVYVKTDMGEISVNPYHILRMLEEDRTTYSTEE